MTQENSDVPENKDRSNLDSQSLKIQKRILKIVSEKKTEQKDFWDKLSTSFALIIAVAGSIFTWIYNNQQNKKEQLSRDQQLNIQRIEIVEKFMRLT